MAVKNEIFRSHLFYFIAILLVVYISNTIQTLFFAQMSSAWLHIDMVSIIIVYLSLEHHILFAASQGILAGALMQISSSAPHVFFILYFMILIVLVNLSKKFFVIKSIFSKILIFAIVYSVKYILFYLSIDNPHEIGLPTLISTYWREYFATCLAAFFVYELMRNLDSLFVLPGSLKKR